MSISRRAVLEGFAGTTAALLGGTGGYGFLVGRHQLEVTRATLPIAALPPSLSGLRIGLITDVHRSLWVSDDHVMRAVTMMMSETPDVIVLGGDFVTWGDRGYVGAAAEALGQLSAPFGVFGILGNHDDDHDMPAALAAQGVQMLKDARTTVSIKGETVDVVGIRFWTRRGSDIAPLVRGGDRFRVLLAHDPRRLVEAAALKIPLLLSGHTHGGQVVLPGIGALDKHRFPVLAGTARRGPTTIFVSRGVGTVYVPVRINCPPEIALLTLESAPHAA
jgi:predicted MPP superfamily phosphohydrolase